jgi:DNA-binding PadR family transcriptional regulator
MAYVDKCDMRGFLSFQVLWLLSRRSMCGEDLAEELMRRRGEKPKPGTLYPALKDLRERGLIRGKRSGNMIKYDLTDEGKEAVRRAKIYFVRCFGEIFAEG